MLLARGCDDRVTVGFAGSGRVCKAGLGVIWPQRACAEAFMSRTRPRLWPHTCVAALNARQPHTQTNDSWGFSGHRQKCSSTQQHSGLFTFHTAVPPACINVACALLRARRRKQAPRLQLHFSCHNGLAASRTPSASSSSSSRRIASTLLVLVPTPCPDCTRRREHQRVPRATCNLHHVL